MQASGVVLQEMLARFIQSSHSMTLVPYYVLHSLHPAYCSTAVHMMLSSAKHGNSTAPSAPIPQPPWDRKVKSDLPVTQFFLRTVTGL